MKPIADALNNVLANRKLAWSDADRALVARCIGRALQLGVAMAAVGITGDEILNLLAEGRQVKAQAANVTAAAAQDLASVTRDTIARYLGQLEGFALHALGVALA